MNIHDAKIQFKNLFKLNREAKCFFFLHVRKRFRPITKHLQGELYFEQLCLSCSQKNFGLIEPSVSLSHVSRTK